MGVHLPFVGVSTAFFLELFIFHPLKFKNKNFFLIFVTKKIFPRVLWCSAYQTADDCLVVAPLAYLTPGKFPKQH
jgi:hypothetical protein